jgi:hypothetical protein
MVQRERKRLLREPVASSGNPIYALSVLVQLDNETYRVLNKVAPPAQRKRKAIRDAIRREEYQKIRRACEAQPDSSADADDWSNPGTFAILGV